MSRLARTLVIGLDGATWDLLDPLFDGGHAPHLADLVAGSARGELLATFPPVTAPSWTSFATGLNPGRHGVFDFFDLDGDRYRKRVINLSRMREACLWDHVEQAGGRSVVMNLPTVYPAKTIAGICVSGMLTPSGQPAFRPAWLQERLEPALGRYEIDAPWPGGGAEALPQYLDTTRTCVETRGRWAKALLRAERWDLGVVVFVAPDRLQHKAWNSLRHGSGPGRVREAGLAVWRALDQAVAGLLEVAGSECDVYLVSDHGFGGAARELEANVALAQAGLLRRRPGALASVRATKLARHALGPTSPRRGGQGGVGESTTGRAFERLVDWPRTRAFMLSVTDMGIYVNTRGRFAQGIVEPGAERESVVAEIQEALGNLRDGTDRHAPLPMKTMRREDLFEGPRVSEAADLLFVADSGAIHCGTRADGPLIHDAPFLRGDGNHRLEGIVTLRGADITAGATIPEATILDLAPTILERMGINLEASLDGRALRPTGDGRALAPWEAGPKCRQAILALGAQGP